MYNKPDFDALALSLSACTAKARFRQVPGLTLNTAAGYSLRVFFFFFDVPRYRDCRYSQA